jgi:hypothetical protein
VYLIMKSSVYIFCRVGKEDSDQQPTVSATVNSRDSGEVEYTAADAVG